VIGLSAKEQKKERSEFLGAKPSNREKERRESMALSL
jgi:hypothetical protein